jgi:hypothetical protein
MADHDFSVAGYDKDVANIEEDLPLNFGLKKFVRIPCSNLPF